MTASYESLRPIVNQPWRYRAACRNEDPKLFDGWVDFEPIADRRRRWQKALAVCYRCPVIRECRKDGAHEEGIRGGRCPLMPSPR